MALFIVSIHVLVLCSRTYSHLIYGSGGICSPLHSVCCDIIGSIYVSLLQKSYYANLMDGLAELYMLPSVSFISFSVFNISIEVWSVPNTA